VREARADVATPYDVTRCWADIHTEDRFTRSPGRLANNTDTILTAHCPIVKKTSGPGITQDALISASIPIETTGASVACTVSSWASTVIDLSHSNLLGRVTRSRAASPILLFPRERNRIDGYWDANGTSTPSAPAWYFLDLKCKLNPGTAIRNYTITEEGTEQPVHRIHSMLNCAPASSNSMPIIYHDGSWDPGLSKNGGFVTGQASFGTKFAMACPLQNNTVGHVAVIPTGVSGITVGCRMDSQSFTTFTWPAVDSPGYPSEVLGRAGQRAMAVPLTGSHTMYCGVNAATGDGRLIGYREGPQPSRAGWTVTASTGSGRSNAVDDDPETRYTTREDAAPGHWVQVDMGTTRLVRQVSIDSGESINDYARAYEVHTSTNGVDWVPAASVTGNQPYSTVFFPARNARFVRVRLTAGSSYWWSIHELNVY
jgi:hypothetical protein